MAVVARRSRNNLNSIELAAHLPGARNDKHQWERPGEIAQGFNPLDRECLNNYSITNGLS